MRAKQTTLNISAVLAGLFLVTSVSSAAAQENPRRIQYGPLELHGFTVEEALLNPPHREPLPDGTVRRHHFGYQITVMAKSFPVRALDPVVWIGSRSLHHYEPVEAHGARYSALVFTFYDPDVLRFESDVQVIYGDDERTRTKFMRRFDPEMIERLPDDLRRRHGVPDLAHLTFDKPQTAAGRALLRGTIELDDASEVRIRAVLKDGATRELAHGVDAEKGRFEVAVTVPKGVERIQACLVMPKLLRGRTVNEWQVLDTLKL